MKRPSNQDSDGEGGRAVSSDGNGQVKSFQEREADYIKARSRILGSSKTNGSSPPTLSPQLASPPASPSSSPDAAVLGQISSTAPAVLPQSISPPSADVSRSPPSPAPAHPSPPPCTAPPASMLPQPEGWCAPQYPPYSQFMAQPYAPHVYQGNGHVYPPMPPNMMPPRMMMPVMTSQLPLCYQQQPRYQQPPMYMQQPPYVHQPQMHQIYGTPYGMPPMPPTQMMSYNVDAPVFQPRQPQPGVATTESKDMPKTAKAAPKWANPKAADAAPAKGNAGESVAKKTNKDNSDSVNARGALSGKIRLKNGGNTNKAESSTGKAIEILKRKQSPPPGAAEEAAVNGAEKPASEEGDGEGNATTQPKEKKKKAPRKKKSQANLNQNGGDPKAESDEIKENDDEMSVPVTKKGKQKGKGKQKPESVNVRNAAVRTPLLLKDINKSANERILRVPKGPDGTAGFNLVRDFSGISIV